MKTLEVAIAKIGQVRKRIDQAAQAAGRDVSQVQLIGAAKQQEPQWVQAFTEAGLKDIGHNYLQQALEQKQHLQDPSLSWHFIGHIQSNKTASIAAEFDWVHSVDRLKVARRLSEQRSEETPLNVLIQVDIDKESSKGGVAPEQCIELANQISELPNLKLRGLMVLPRARKDLESQREPFAKTRELFDECNQLLADKMDSLSMGMSGDLEAAILEGSTMVRIGTDLFGKRD